MTRASALSAYCDHTDKVRDTGTGRANRVSILDAMAYHPFEREEKRTEKKKAVKSTKSADKPKPDKDNTSKVDTKAEKKEDAPVIVPDVSVSAPVLAPPNAMYNETKEESLANRSANGVVTFPLRLHMMLKGVEENGQTEYISWNEHGKSFSIFRKEAMADILPQYFPNQTKMTSFRRQLQYYGFTRLNGIAPLTPVYSHPSFVRNRPSLCLTMVNTRVPKSKYRKEKKEGEKLDKEKKEKRPYKRRKPKVLNVQSEQITSQLYSLMPRPSDPDYPGESYTCGEGPLRDSSSSSHLHGGHGQPQSTPEREIGLDEETLFCFEHLESTPAMESEYSESSEDYATKSGRPRMVTSSYDCPSYNSSMASISFVSLLDTVAKARNQDVKGLAEASAIDGLTALAAAARGLS